MVRYISAYVKPRQNLGYDIDRLMRACRSSIESLGDTLEIVEAPPATADNLASLCTWRIQAFAHVIGRAIARGDTRPIVFLDGDTVVLRDTTPIFKGEPVYITTRPVEPQVNAGVVYATPTVEALQVFREWDSQNQRKRRDDLKAALKRVYSAPDQAALAAVALTSPYVTTIPTMLHNHADQEWDYTGDDVYVLHCKGKLRRACLGKPMDEQRIQHWTAVWKQYDR
jgi:hypothetical protein